MSFWHLGAQRNLAELNGTDYLLVHFNSNWADEADFEGFRVMSVERWISYCKSFDNSQPYTMSFGTNEENEYSEARDILDEFYVYFLTPEQAETLNQIFANGFGTFPEEPYEEFDEYDENEEGD